MYASLNYWLADPSSKSLGFVITLFLASGLLPLPRTLICMVAGTMFGASAGMLLMSGASATVGAIAAFLVARHLGAEKLQSQIVKWPRIRLVAHAIDKESWRIVALCRLGVPAPAFLVNYMFGLSRMRIVPYTWATFIFILPQTFVFLYIGAVGRSALLEDASSSLNRSFSVLSVLCMLGILIVVSRRVKAEFLNQQEWPGSP